MGVLTDTSDALYLSISLISLICLGGMYDVGSSSALRRWARIVESILSVFILASAIALVLSG